LDDLYFVNSYTYTGLGIVLNTNYSTVWSADGGTILSSDNNSAIIRWNLLPEEQGQVRMTVANNCPGGETREFTMNVSVY